MYRSLLRGSAGFSKAEELFGSLLLENVKNHLNDAEWARRKGYLGMSRAIALWERAIGADPSVIERNWRFSDLAGIEESWRDDRIWLLSALTDVCDLRCFYSTCNRKAAQMKTVSEKSSTFFSDYVFLRSMLSVA